MQLKSNTFLFAYPMILCYNSGNRLIMGGENMVTLKQIADMLGVSPTTVSNVVNGRTGKMSAETKQRIEEALWQNHYEIPLKSSSSSSEEQMIAAAFYMGGYRNVLMDPFCGELLGAIEQESKALGYRMIYDVPNEDDDEDLLRLFSPWNLSGGILLGYDQNKCRALEKRISKPLVFIDSFFGGIEESFDNIGLQDYEGACELTSYLIKLGHRSIAFFCDQKPPVASNGERFRGFCDTLSAFGISFKDTDYYFLPSDKNLRLEVLRQFARKSGKHYTAAFFTSDYFANESINVFFSYGLHVPDDISVTGFDDNIYARLSRPMLTTIRQSPTDKGRMAVRLLVGRIHGENGAYHTVQLPTELIVRDSVKNIGPV